MHLLTTYRQNVKLEKQGDINGLQRKVSGMLSR